MRKIPLFIVLLVLLVALVPVARADEEVPVSWDRDPQSLEGYGRATGRAERPLTEWTAVEVAASGPYTVCVQTVYGETLVDIRGTTAGQLALSGSAPLRISYEGPPARVRVMGRERRMAPRASGASGWPIRYETGDAVVPEGAGYCSDAVVLVPGSGRKAARVCAVWGGADLHIRFLDAASGAEIGRADLVTGQTCTIVYGRVNRPYTIIVEPVGGPAQIYDLEVR
jgi:hypothetical protein